MTVCLCFSDKELLKPSDVSIFSSLSINGRLFVCPRDQIDSLVSKSPWRLHLWHTSAVNTQDQTYISLLTGWLTDQSIDSFMQTPLPEQEGPSAGSMSTFELMSSKDLAHQMTLYDWELFDCVHEVQTHSSASVLKLLSLKGIIHPKMKILSLYMYPHVIPNSL